MKYQVRQINDEVFQSDYDLSNRKLHDMGRFPNKFPQLLLIFRAKVCVYTRSVPHINKLCNKVSNLSPATRVCQF